MNILQSIIKQVLLLAVLASLYSCTKESSLVNENSDICNILKTYGWKTSGTDFSYLFYGSSEDPEFSFDIESSTYFFLDDDIGVVRTYRHGEDTYFGSSNNVISTYYNWYVDDSGVIILNNDYSTIKLQLDGDKLIQLNSSSPCELLKTSITSADREYLRIRKGIYENNKGEFKVDISLKTEERGYVKNNGIYYYPVTPCIKIYGEYFPYSCGVGALEVNLTIQNGTGAIYGNQTKGTFEVSINADKDIYKEFSLDLFVSGDRPTFTISCRAWDYKNGKWISMGKNWTGSQVSIAKPDYVKELENGNSGDNGGNSGDNNSDSYSDDEDTGSDYIGGLNAGAKLRDNPGPQPMKYKINGNEYKFILVDGGNMHPYYMMQTELPLNATFEINGKTYGPLMNDQGIITVSTYLKFIQELRAATGWNLRMPTEEEWIFAAKGGKYSKGYKYAGSNNIEDVAWYNGNTKNIDISKWYKGSTYPAKDVAQKKSNELDLYDMSGNYGELTYFESSPGREGIDGHLYGGCWRSKENECLPTSWVVYDGYGSIRSTGKDFKHHNGADALTESFRLVYQKP